MSIVVRVRIRLMGAAALLCVPVLAGCGSDEPAAADPAPAPVVASSKPVKAGPDAKAVAAYLDGLGKIDPGLVVNEDRAVRRAESTCADIAAGEITGAKLNARVAERLSGGNATIDASQAAKAVELMKKHIC